MGIERVIDTPDERGLGRIVVDGRYYGVPMVVVEALQEYAEMLAWREDHKYDGFERDLNN